MIAGGLQHTETAILTLIVRNDFAPKLKDSFGVSRAGIHPCNNALRSLTVSC